MGKLQMADESKISSLGKFHPYLSLDLAFLVQTAEAPFQVRGL